MTTTATMQRAPSQPDDTHTAWFDEQLYALLTGICSSDVAATTILSNAEKNWGCRGALSWFVTGKGLTYQGGQISRHRSPSHGQLRQGPEEFGDVGDQCPGIRVDQGRAMPEFDKVVTIKDMMPADVRRDVDALEKSGYLEVHSYVSRQLARRREEERRQMRKSGNPLGALDEREKGPGEEEALSVQRGSCSPGASPGA